MVLHELQSPRFCGVFLLLGTLAISASICNAWVDELAKPKPQSTTAKTYLLAWPDKADVLRLPPS